MPITPVQVNVRQSTKKDTWDKIAVGLKIADSILGSAVSADKLTDFTGNAATARQAELDKLAIQARNKSAETLQEQDFKVVESQKDRDAAQLRAQTIASSGLLPQGVTANTLTPGQKGNLTPNQLKTVKLQQEVTANDQDALTPSATQSMAGLYSKQMELSENVFTELEDLGFDRSTAKSSAQGYLPELVKPEDIKRQQQAEGNFLNASLRRQSGAVISPSEEAKGEMRYFPRAGDTPKVKEQKRQNRLLDMEALRLEAGPKVFKPGAPTPKKEKSVSDRDRLLQYLGQ